MKQALTASNFAVLSWVLLLVAVPTVLYVSHVYGQLGEVRENNLRTLSKAAESTNQTLQTAEDNVRNLRKKPKFVCDFILRQPYLEWSENQAWNSEQAWDEKSFCQSLKAIDDNNADLMRMGMIFASAKLRADDNGIQVVAGRDMLPGDSGAVPDPQSNFASSSNLPEAFLFNVRLDSLLADIPFSNALDLLFIADERGNVIHQHQPQGRLDVGLLVSSLNKLPTGSEGEFTDKDALQRASSINKVQLSGVDYQLLCQPLEVRLSETAVATGTDGEDEADEADAAADVSGNFVLCGLVASERSLRESLAVAPFLALAFFAVTVFGFLSWPAIKLMWMSKHDRLYFADLCYLLFGTAGGLLLATTLILGIGSYRSLAADSKTSLEQLALQIQFNLQREIDSVAGALRQIDGNLKDYVVSKGIAGLEKPALEERLQDIGRVYAKVPSDPNEVPIWPGLQPDNWPVKSDFEFAFWADCHGDQFFKATTLAQNTPRVNIAKREYFSAVLENRVSGGTAGEDRAPFVQPVRSITTGKFATVVSIDSDLDIHAADGGGPRLSGPGSRSAGNCSGIAAAQVLLISTSMPVLPPGVGFAIVDQDGTALLHSDERRALFEKLYEEMADGERLQAVVMARASEHMNTSYMARPHRVFVMPIKHMPWSIVTFSDTEMISTANIEILAHASVLSFIFLFTYALLAACYFVYRGAEVPLWFWPGSHTQMVSRWSVGIPAGALVAQIISLAMLEGDQLLIATFCLPLLVLVGIYVAYGQTFHLSPRAGRSADVRPAQVWANIASLCVAWVVLAVVPAGIFFKAALDNQALVLTRYENEHLAEKMVARNCAIDSHYKSIDGSAKIFCNDGADSCGLGTRRSYTAGDLYPSSVFWVNREQTSSTLLAEQRLDDNAVELDKCDSDSLKPRSVWNYLAHIKPIFNDTVVRSRYLQPEAQYGIVNNACWYWQPDTDARTAKFSAGPLACGTNVRLASNLPLGPEVFGHLGVFVFGAALLLMLFFWTRYGARNLFFGDLQLPPLRDRAGLEERLLEKPNNSKVRLVAIAASQWDRSNLLHPPTPDPANTDKQFSKSHGQHARHDMLDYMAGTSARAALLDNLSKDVAAGKNILLVSPVDPYSLLATTQPATDDDADTQSIEIGRQKDHELLRWRRVLSKFRVVVVSIKVSPRPLVWEGNWQRKLDKDVDIPWLLAESRAVPELQPLYSFLEDELVGSSRRNALLRIVERAFGIYMAFWDACTDDEKLVLVQLAFENVVNPKQVAIVRRLIQRGLIVRDPRLRVMNQSFSLFITQVYDPSVVKEWELNSSQSSWASKRWVVLGVLMLGLLFLWATQRELFNNSLMFLSAAAVSLPGVIRLMTTFSKPGN